MSVHLHTNVSCLIGVVVPPPHPHLFAAPCRCKKVSRHCISFFLCVGSIFLCTPVCFVPHRSPSRLHLPAHLRMCFLSLPLSRLCVMKLYILANDRLGEEPQAGGGIKKFLRTGGGSTVGPSALSRTSPSAVGGRRGGETHAFFFRSTAASGSIL